MNDDGERGKIPKAHKSSKQSLNEEENILINHEKIAEQLCKI